MSETKARKRSAERISVFFQDIFARRKAQDHLQFQATILQNVSESLIITDLQGRIIYWNAGATSLFGYTAEEMLGNTPGLLYPEMQEQLLLLDLKLILEGKDYIGVWKGRRKDGTPIWIDIKTTLLRDTRGVAIGFIGFAKDITERRRVEEASFRLAAIVESSNDAIIGKTKEGIITSWNSAAERIFGYTAEEAVGQPVTLLLPPDREDEFTTFMEQIAHGEEVNHYETTRVRKDGTVIAVSVTFSPIHNSEGQIIGASAIIQDITEQKRLEAEVRQSKQQLEVILQNIADGITVQDKRGNIIFTNDAGAKMCGFASAQDMLALDLESLRTYYLDRFEIRDESGQLVSYSMLPAYKALQGERYAEALLQYSNRQTGITFWALVKASPIFDERGQVQFSVNIFSDLTGRMELEQRKNTFIGMASHELKTPITSLKGFTQLLSRKIEKQDMQGSSKLLASMETQITRLTKLIDDLLDVAKIEAGNLEYAEESFELNTLIQDIVETIQQTSSTHTVTIHGTAQNQVIGDSDRLGQVFINLITNAIKYSPDAKTVDVSITNADDEVVVSVRDYGIGISQEHQSKVFERFYRVYDDKEKIFPGLGMGLHISYEIIKQHNGKIWVESSEGKGSTFFVSLPIAG